MKTWSGGSGKRVREWEEMEWGLEGLIQFFKRDKERGEDKTKRKGREGNRMRMKEREIWKGEG